MELLKENILITGASAGIGYAVAKRLAHAGAKSLIMTARRKTKLETRAGLLGLTRVCDHSDKSAIDALCEWLHEDGLQPGVLIANVGMNPFHFSGPKKLQNTDYHIFEETLRVNTINTFHLISQLVVAMKGRKLGRIILVGSQAYRYGIKGQCAYNVSKAALVGLKNTIVAEYGHAGIFCHLVNPGLVANHRTETMRKRSRINIKTVSETEVAECIIETLAITDPSRNGLEVDI